MLRVCFDRDRRVLCTVGSLLWERGCAGHLDVIRDFPDDEFMQAAAFERAERKRRAQDAQEPLFHQRPSVSATSSPTCARGTPQRK